MATKPAPVPTEFDDQLEALVQIAKKLAKPVEGVDALVLAQDLTVQRAEKLKDTDLWNAYNEFHKTFATAQATRYARYMKAVAVLRALYRDMPEKLAPLDVLKRPRTKRAATPSA